MNPFSGQHTYTRHTFALFTHEVNWNQSNGRSVATNGQTGHNNWLLWVECLQIFRVMCGSSFFGHLFLFLFYWPTTSRWPLKDPQWTRLRNFTSQWKMVDYSFYTRGCLVELLHICNSFCQVLPFHPLIVVWIEFECLTVHVYSTFVDWCRAQVEFKLNTQDTSVLS